MDLSSPRFLRSQQNENARIHFTIPVPLAFILLAHGALAQSNRIGPAEIYPDSARTRGASSPRVTQQNIKDTICSPHWSTKQIRPPAAYTNKLKKKQLREYSDTVHQTKAQLINPTTGKVDSTRCVSHSDSPACYEEDHLISLEDRVASIAHGVRESMNAAPILDGRRV